MFRSGVGNPDIYILVLDPKKQKKSKTTTNKKQTVGEATAQEKNPKKAYNKSSAKAETCFGHRAK